MVKMAKAAKEKRVTWAGDFNYKCLLSAILAAVCSGPLLFVTIHQVCVSKCLLMHRLPSMGQNADDLILILLFLLFVLLNFLTCCFLWSFVRHAICMCWRSVTLASALEPFAEPTFMDPKVTRSGRPYGFRKARYVASHTTARTRHSCGSR